MNNINKLFMIMEDIYECYMDFLSGKCDKDVTAFKITKLCIEEEKLIKLFPYNIKSLEEMSVVVGNHYYNESPKKKYFILKRFNNILDSLKEKIECETTPPDLLNDEFYDGYGVSNLCLENLQRKIIEDSSDLGYLMCFSNRNIEKELLINQFNLSKIKSYSVHDMSLKTSKDESKYIEFYKDFLDSEIINLFYEIISTFSLEDSEDLISTNLDILKNILLSLSSREYASVKKNINKCRFLPQELEDRLSNYFNEIEQVINSRNIQVTDDSLDFDDTRYVDMDIFNALVNLIKLEENILDKYDNLDLSDKSSVSILSNMLEFEKDMVNSIFIDDYDANNFKDVIGNDIEFFLEKSFSNRSIKLIQNRIKNLFPVFYGKMSPSIPYKNYDLVISNHIVNSLDRYRDLICDIKSEADIFKYIKVYKDIIFMYPNVLNDIVSTNYDFTALFSFNDDDSSNILGLNKRKLQYSCDKDEILYNVAKEIVEDLRDILIEMDENSELIALYEFKICEFNDIISNINTEHLYALEADVECISDSRIKSILMKKFSFNHKY